jgi:hypothetical protein
MKYFLPPTANRVRLSTCKNTNDKIVQDTLNNISYYMGKSKEEIEDRIRELDEEWDIDRVFEAKTAGAIIMAAILGSKLNKKWFLMAGMEGIFLLQHALIGWSPSLELLRRMGIRTCGEINYEKKVLKSML